MPPKFPVELSSAQIRLVEKIIDGISYMHPVTLDVLANDEISDLEIIRVQLDLAEASIVQEGVLALRRQDYYSCHYCFFRDPNPEETFQHMIKHHASG